MVRTKYIAGIFLFMLASLSSCIYDDQSDCTLDLRFRYVYNMQNADGFTREVDEVEVYVFDASDRFVGKYQTGVTEGKDCVVSLQLPTPGKYTFVAWANGLNEKDDAAFFEMPSRDKCSKPQDLSARIRRTENRVNHKLNSLLNGVLQAEVSGANRHLTIEMMKCTNALRVILMPARA